MIKGFKEFPTEAINDKEGGHVEVWVGEVLDLKRLRLNISGDAHLTLHQARELIATLQRAISPERLRVLRRLAAQRRKARQVDEIRSIFVPVEPDSEEP